MNSSQRALQINEKFLFQFFLNYMAKSLKIFKQIARREY